MPEFADPAAIVDAIVVRIEQNPHLMINDADTLIAHMLNPISQYADLRVYDLLLEEVRAFWPRTMKLNETAITIRLQSSGDYVLAPAERMLLVAALMDGPIRDTRGLNTFWEIFGEDLSESDDPAATKQALRQIVNRKQRMPLIDHLLNLDLDTAERTRRHVPDYKQTTGYQAEKAHYVYMELLNPEAPRRTVASSVVQQAVAIAQDTTASPKVVMARHASLLKKRPTLAKATTYGELTDHLIPALINYADDIDLFVDASYDEDYGEEDVPAYQQVIRFYNAMFILAGEVRETWTATGIETVLSALWSDSVDNIDVELEIMFDELNQQHLVNNAAELQQAIATFYQDDDDDEYDSELSSAEQDQLADLADKIEAFGIGQQVPDISDVELINDFPVEALILAGGWTFQEFFNAMTLRPDVPQNLIGDFAYTFAQPLFKVAYPMAEMAKLSGTPLGLADSVFWQKAVFSMLNSDAEMTDEERVRLAVPLFVGHDVSVTVGNRNEFAKAIRRPLRAVGITKAMLNKWVHVTQLQNSDIISFMDAKRKH
jgi:hypothetical protein